MTKLLELQVEEYKYLYNYANNVGCIPFQDTLLTTVLIQYPINFPYISSDLYIERATIVRVAIWSGGSGVFVECELLIKYILSQNLVVESLLRS